MHLAGGVLPMIGERMRAGPLLTCAAAAVAAACGGSQPLPPKEASRDVPAAPPGASLPPTTPSQPTVNLVLRGVDSSAYAGVHLDVERLTVEVDHAALPVTPAQAAVDLASAAGTSLGSFSLPAEAARVRISIVLAPTGTWHTRAGAGRIDARGLPISFDAAAADLSRHRVVEMQLNVATSLQPTDDGVAVLLPDVVIVF